jgi:hypothetical protein
MSIAFEPTIQNGFLSTAFHRVYFAGADQAALEKLPDSRVKFPLSLRLNYYMDDWIISRSFYRYYTDDFGITAHTFNQEFPIRFNQTYSIIPFYRFSTQSESDYFAPMVSTPVSMNFTPVILTCLVSTVTSLDWDFAIIRLRAWDLLVCLCSIAAYLLISLNCGWHNTTAQMD